MSEKPRCLETRRTPYALKRRRYNNGLVTYELPETVVRSIGKRTVKRWMDTYKNGELLRSRSAELRAQVIARDGWKATAVAHDLGITEARVRQIRKELEAKQVAALAPKEELCTL